MSERRASTRKSISSADLVVVKKSTRKSTKKDDSAVNSPASSDTSEQQRKSWCIGTEIQARDPNDKWYDSRIVEIDNNRVLVHFLGWNSRYDQWFDIDSQDLRNSSKTGDDEKPATPEQPQHAISPAPQFKHSSGEIVMALWHKDGQYYPARVLRQQVRPNSQLYYEVKFYDGVRKMERAEDVHEPTEQERTLRADEMTQIEKQVQQRQRTMSSSTVNTSMSTPMDVVETSNTSMAVEEVSKEMATNKEADTTNEINAVDQMPTSEVKETPVDMIADEQQQHGEPSTAEPRGLAEPPETPAALPSLNTSVSTSRRSSRTIKRPHMFSDDEMVFFDQSTKSFVSPQQTPASVKRRRLTSTNIETPSQQGENKNEHEHEEEAVSPTALAKNSNFLKSLGLFKGNKKVSSQKQVNKIEEPMAITPPNKSSGRQQRSASFAVASTITTTTLSGSGKKSKSNKKDSETITSPKKTKKDKKREKKERKKLKRDKMLAELLEKSNLQLQQQQEILNKHKDELAQKKKQKKLLKEQKKQQQQTNAFTSMFSPTAFFFPPLPPPSIQGIEQHIKKQQQQQFLFPYQQRSSPAATNIVPQSPMLPPQIPTTPTDIKCTIANCNKTFRKQSLFDKHLRYYHYVTDETAASVLTATENVATDAPSATTTTNELAREESIYDPTADPYEVIHCKCGSHTNSGFMLQCETCLCWQHGECEHVDSQDKVPKNYLCWICSQTGNRKKRLRYKSTWLHQQKQLFDENAVPGSDMHAASMKLLNECSQIYQQLNSLMYALEYEISILNNCKITTDGVVVDETTKEKIRGNVIHLQNYLIRRFSALDKKLDDLETKCPASATTMTDDFNLQVLYDKLESILEPKTTIE